MLILATSKIQSNYQTTIPKEIRKNYDIDNDTVVEWAINEKGNPEINFRKKRRFKDLVGAFKTEGVCTNEQCIPGHFIYTGIC